MTTEYVVWGFKDFLPLPLPIARTGGNLRHCRAEQRTRTAEGWRTAIYAKGTAPTGLRLIVAEQRGVTLDEALAYLH